MARITPICNGEYRLRVVSLIALFALVMPLASCARLMPGLEGSAYPIEEDGSYGDYLSARMAAAEHDLPNAAKYFIAAHDKDPDNSSITMLAFFYSASVGNMKEASKLAELVTKTNPDDRAARLELAEAAMKRDDYADARKQLTQSAKGPFTSVTVSLLDAWAAAGAGDSAAALKDIDDLQAQHSADALAVFHRALIAEFVGQPELAEKSYVEVLGVAGPSPRIVDAFGRFLEHAGRSKDALALYDKYKDEPAVAPILHVARARIAAGEKPEPMLKSAAEGAGEALFGIAASLTDANSADVSILYLRFALDLNPGLDLADILLADRMETLGRYDDAIGVYRSIAEDSPYYSLSCIEIAVDEMRLNKTDDAISQLKEVTDREPANIEALTALGDVYRGAERFAEAADAYDRAIKARGKIEQKDWPLLYARAISEERSHHWDAAEADLKEALKLSPDEPEVLNYLGYSWVDQGKNIPEALGMLEKARALRPLDGYIIDSVGWAYFRLGRYADATKTLEDAILLVPGDPTINDHLGDAYWKVGRKLEAQFQWSHALAFGPDAQAKSEIEKKLKVGLNGDGNRS